MSINEDNGNKGLTARFKRTYCRLNIWCIRGYYKRKNFIIYEEHISHQPRTTHAVIERELRAFTHNTQRIFRKLLSLKST